MRLPSAVLFIPLLLLLTFLALPCVAEIPGQLLSATSPIAARLTTPSARFVLAPLHTLLSTLSTAIDSRLSPISTHACNLRGVQWINSAERIFDRAQLGPLNNTCRTSLSFTPSVLSEELSPAIADSAYPVLRAASAVLSAAAIHYAEHAIPSATAAEWFPAQDRTVVRGSQRCAVQSAAAFRQNGAWYVRAAATNRPLHAFVPGDQRMFVEEFVRVDLGPSLTFRARVWPSAEDDEQGQEDREAKKNGTTVVRTSGGVAPFAYVPMGLDENPALSEAMRLNEVAVDQARDAITLSNVAILALPMVVSLVPMAFVADLNTCATLLYILFTDLLASLPFLIKGVELVYTGSARRGETVAYHIGSPELGLLEVWSVACQGDSSFRALGIAFICVAAGAMVFGLVLEVVAANVMHRKRRRMASQKLEKGEALGPFGDAWLVESVEEYEVWSEKEEVNSRWVRFVDRRWWRGMPWTREGAKDKRVLKHKDQFRETDEKKKSEVIGEYCFAEKFQAGKQLYEEEDFGWG